MATVDPRAIEDVHRSRPGDPRALGVAIEELTGDLATILVQQHEHHRRTHHLRQRLVLPITALVQRAHQAGITRSSRDRSDRRPTARLTLPPILLEEWAHIRDWHTDTERTAHYEHFIHFYNHHRARGALEWSTPSATLKDNVTGQHT
jgi:hypothetical protein